MHDRQGLRRRRARARSGAPPAGRTDRRDQRRGATARPDAARLPHRLRRRPPGGDRQAVGDLQRPLRPQGDRDRDGPDARRLASQGQAGDRDAALHRAPHRQGHVGPALLREDAPGRARAARGLSTPHRPPLLPGGGGGRRRRDAHRIAPDRRSRRRDPRVDPPHRRRASSPSRSWSPCVACGRRRCAASASKPGARTRSGFTSRNAATRSSAKRSTFATCVAPVENHFPPHA